MLNNNDLQAYSQAYVYPSGAGTTYYSRAQNNNDLQAYSQTYVYPSGAGTTYYSRAQKITVFNRIPVAKSLFFCVVFFFTIACLFLLAIVFSVLLQFFVSDWYLQTFRTWKSVVSRHVIRYNVQYTRIL